MRKAMEDLPMTKECVVPKGDICCMSTAVSGRLEETWASKVRGGQERNGGKKERERRGTWVDGWIHNVCTCSVHVVDIVTVVDMTLCCRKTKCVPMSTNKHQSSPFSSLLLPSRPSSSCLSPSLPLSSSSPIAPPRTANSPPRLSTPPASPRATRSKPTAIFSASATASTSARGSRLRSLISRYVGGNTYTS